MYAIDAFQIANGLKKMNRQIGVDATTLQKQGIPSEIRPVCQRDQAVERTRRIATHVGAHELPQGLVIVERVMGVQMTLLQGLYV